MLKNAEYIYDNIILADELNTTKQYCKKAQVGVDLSIKSILKIREPGIVLKNKTYAPEYDELSKCKFRSSKTGKEDIVGWRVPMGTYIAVLNEGCSFGPSDTGLIILRSSLNRSGVSIQSAVWDPGYKSVGEKGIISPMSVRMTVDTQEGFLIEENSRIAQLIVFENADTELYNGQWQNGLLKSKLESK